MTMNDEGLLVWSKSQGCPLFPRQFSPLPKMSLKIDFECVNYLSIMDITTDR
jgi:hypothetical protein